MDTLSVKERVTQVATPVDQPSTKNRKRRMAWLALVGALCLASGATLAAVELNTSATPELVDAPSREVAADDAFADYVTSEGLTRYGDVQTLKSLADGVCDAFDNGAQWMSVLSIALNNGFTSYDAGAFIAASVLSYCPENTDALP